jgi:hypothetical protein
MPVSKKQKPFVLMNAGRPPAGTIYGLNGQTIVGDANGAWTVTANGTNQNITLTPSGTGVVAAQKAATGAEIYSFQVNRQNSATGALRFGADGSTNGVIAANNGKLRVGKDVAGTFTEWLRFDDADGSALFGTTTNSANGRIQLATHTTSAGGIGFGTDAALFRSAAGQVDFQHTAGDATFRFLGSGGTSRGSLVVSGTSFIVQAVTNNLILQSNSTTALTIDSSQNATFAGAIIGGVQALSGAGAVNVTQLHTSYTSTGVAQALTLANGTSGQIKTITHTVDGGSGVLTPTTALGYTTITFTNAGDSVTLRYTSAGWAIVGIYGAVAA